MSLPRLRHAAFVVAVNLLAITALLGTAELGVRLLGGPVRVDQDRQLPMCRPDALTIWRYKPDIALTYRAPEFEMTIRTNGEGLRNSDLPAADLPTILFIGDSFTFGWGVEERERFSDLVAGLLPAATTGPGVRIVNAGHWMFTFDQQLVLMRQLVETYRPAVVVQGFYWMHVRSLFNHRLMRAPDGSLEAVQDPKIAVGDDGVLRFRSDWLERPPFGSQLVAMVARALLNRDLRERAADWVDYMRPGSDRDEQLWKTTDGLVGETIGMLRTQRIAYVPFLIPASVEVGAPWWSHVGWMGATPPPDIDPSLPAKRLAAMFSQRGIEAEELAGPLREMGGASLYYPGDGHWNAAGHEAAARVLAPLVGRALATRAR